MLVIHNITNIVNTKINTTHAQWVIEYVSSNEEYYTIKCSFVYGKTMGKKHPKHIYFQLYRNKMDNGYYILDSTESSLDRWGLFVAHLENGNSFIHSLKQQLNNL